MRRALQEETQQLESDLNEERSRYQNLLTEHLRLEERYDDLKESISVVSIANSSAVLTSIRHSQTNSFATQLQIASVII